MHKITWLVICFSMSIPAAAMQTPKTHDSEPKNLYIIPQHRKSTTEGIYIPPHKRPGFKSTTSTGASLYIPPHRRPGSQSRKNSKHKTSTQQTSETITKKVNQKKLK